MCGFFYYTYVHVGVGKEAGKYWNNRFITFVPFLCGLTVKLAEGLASICKLESSSKLLFQQTKEELIKVLCNCLAMPFPWWHAYVLFLCFFQAVSDLGMTWEDKEPKVLKSVSR